MRRDASAGTQDMLVFDRLGTDVLNADSLRSYRRRMRAARPGHVWDSLEDEEFFLKIGAIGVGKDGKRHPTSAGLLMFGNEREIVREYPRYSLEYREEYGDIRRRTDRIVSSSGDWSGNVYDFYFRVCRKLQLGLKIPSEAEDGDGKPVRKALREALANCLINADYYGEGGVVIIRREDRIVLSNPGDFRIEVAAAKSGGFSDPRNSLLMKMFNLIDIGDSAGSGIPNIFYTWKQHGWSEPTIKQTVHPNRIEFLLPLMKRGDKVTRIKQEGKKAEMKSALKRAMIIDYLTDHAEGSFEELTSLLGVKPSNTKKLLDDLIEEGIVAITENGMYLLKA
jgi:predicted HTH transcriptional regulator